MVYFFQYSFKRSKPFFCRSHYEFLAYKIQPGQCRIVKEKCPIDLDEIETRGNILSLVQKRRGDGHHYYFYWMVNNPAEVDNFERIYQDTYNLKYAGMLALYREAKDK